jgi:hypothetical protein
MMDPAWSETRSNFNVWFILEFYITKILISMPSRFECISRAIKVTDNNDARWKPEIKTNYVVAKTKWQKFPSYWKTHTYTCTYSTMHNYNFGNGKIQLKAVSNPMSNTAVSYTGLHSYLISCDYSDVSLFLVWGSVTLLVPQQWHDIWIELILLLHKCYTTHI